MMRIWQDTWNNSKSNLRADSERSTQDVVMSGATDREPVDSAVRVTVPTQRQREDEAEGTEILARQTKKPRTEGHTAIDDMVVLYDSAPPHSETELYKQLYKLDKEHALTRQFKHARRLLAELGPCAADLLWREALEDKPTTKVAGQDKMNSNIRKLIETWTFDMPNASPLSTNYNVCPQFTRLVEVLQACETHETSFRGIIIVKRPIVAAMIVELLIALDDTLPDLRPYAIIGPSAFEDAKEQHAVLSAFSSGTYNLVITTKYAEYLHLPRISVVIQYNLFERPPVRILSRVHSDIQNALVIHMVEKNNDLHKRLLQSYRDGGTDVMHAAQIPTDHRVRYYSVSDSENEQESDETPYIQDPVTGCKLYQSDAVAVLHRFTPSQKPSFRMRQDSQGWYICSINFPIGWHMRTVEGTAQPSVASAKDSASYRLCRQLFDKGLLDYRLFSHVTANKTATEDVIEQEKDGQSSSASSTTRCYPRMLPQFWQSTLSVLKDKLYPLIITIGQFKNEYHAPIIVLTRFWLPDLPSFPVFSSGSEATVHMRRGAPLRIDKAGLDALYRYTLRLSRAVVNKPIDCLLENMPYFFAPTDSSWDVDCADLNQEGFPAVSIPWSVVDQAADHWATPILADDGSLDDDSMQDAIIQDRAVEFTNRHYVVKVRYDMTPLSKAEEGEREAGHINFLEYCKSRRKDFPGLKNENQPLVQVSPVAPCVNNLLPSSRAFTFSSKFPAHYLIPELCYKFCIPASTFRTALLLPSIMHAIDSTLLMKETNAKLFGNTIADEHLHAALIAPTTSMAQDYERLELLGDAFLKYSTSTYFYVTMPTAREGSLHGARQRLISNKALRVGAVEAGIPPYIQSKPIVPKIWQPNLYETEDSYPAKIPKDAKGGDDDTSVTSASVGRNSVDVDVSSSRPMQEKQSRLLGGKRKRQRDEHALQWLGDKTVADVVEAIIGAAFLTAGRDLALRTAKILQVPLPAVEQWADFAHFPVPVNENHKVPAHILKRSETIIGYRFEQPALLAEALSHSSSHNGKSYDRLEFLGDAVLDFLTVTHVFNRHTNLSPGGLSLLKGAMVSNATLATVCVLTGLFEYLHYASSDLSATITVYAAKIRALRDEEHKQADKERREPRQFWLELEPPKVLSDIVESVIGAMYVSSGYDIAGAQKYFDDTLKPFFDCHIRLQTLSDHPNTTLTDLFHAESCQQHSIVKEADGSRVRYDVIVHGIVLASASDAISNSALRKAAMGALDVLANDSGFMARVCDCRITRQNKKAQKKKEQQLKQTTQENATAVGTSSPTKQIDSEDDDIIEDDSHLRGKKEVED